MGEKIDGRADQYQPPPRFTRCSPGAHPSSVPRWPASFTTRWPEPPPLPATVPESLRKVVMRMLRKDPAERYQDEAELDRAPRRLRARLCPRQDRPRPTADSLTMGPPSPPTAATAGTRAAPRRQVWLIGAGLAGLCLVAVVVLLKPRHGGHPATTPTTPTTPTGTAPRQQPQPARAP